jgi:hypothetical protein
VSVVACEKETTFRDGEAKAEGYLKWPLSEDPDLVAEWSIGVIFLGVNAEDWAGDTCACNDRGIGVRVCATHGEVATFCLRHCFVFSAIMFRKMSRRAGDGSCPIA